MPRNFGVHRFWHANDNEPELRWPYWVVGAPVLAIITVGMWVQ